MFYNLHPIDTAEYVLEYIDDAYCKWYGHRWEVRFPDDRGSSVLMGWGDTEEEAWDNAAFSIDCYLAD